VLHSATKYLSGHSDVVAGLVVTNSEELGKKIYFVQNALGGVLSPESASLVRRGIQTLSVRMDRQQQNAFEIIHFLEKQSEISKIYYPGIKGTKDYLIASTECHGFGGVLSFELAPQINAAAFVNQLQLICLAVSLGAVESLAELPYEMSHAELPPAERLKAGISTQLIRLAVGIEDSTDLIADLKQAIAFAVAHPVEKQKI